MLYDDIIKKPYGNIYSFDSKEYILTGDFNKSLMGGGPFLVEKKTGRVISFGTAGILENEIKAYENGTLVSALDTFGIQMKTDLIINKISNSICNKIQY
ncbi:hypothetical protein ACQWU4_10745 [Chryseobacterium sp. MIQD13]|uniref:hypothetical protein n=1 Tax=Chryseobacterium sp. MIQD13 TaxID=3422310 RepID=UPI003D27ECF5